MVPVIAVAVGAFFAHERLGPRGLAGAAMVIGGVWLALSGKRAPHVKGIAESHSPA
jgi:drug/metabolite transporter (DMT)-like permease